MDIDDENDLSIGLEHAKGIVEIICKDFEISKECIQIYFTGKKGFRIIIPYKCFGAEPSKDLHKVWKRIAEGFYESGYSTIDTQIYQPNRFLRLPNTIHGDTLLYMIPLTYDELNTISIEQIKELAKKQRDIQCAEPKLSEKANEIYVMNKDCIDRPIQSKALVLENFDITTLRAACYAINEIYDKLANGQHLSHNQNVFLSKVLIAFGEDGENEIHRLLQLSEKEKYNKKYTQYQINYSKKGKYPPNCDYVRKNWDLCANCSGSTNPIEQMKKMPLRLCVSELQANLIGRNVQLDVQITGEQTQKALPKLIKIECSRCLRNLEMDLSKGNDVELISSLIFNDYDTLKKYAMINFESEHSNSCRKEKEHKIRLEFSDFMDYSILYVRDIMDKLKKFELRTYNSRCVYLVNMLPPVVKKVKIFGTIIVEPKSRNISILADRIEPKEDEVGTFLIKDEDKKNWPKYFNENVKLANQISPETVGNAREIAKEALMLLLHSPAVIPDIDGRYIRGGLRIIFFGDTKTCKSTIARDVCGDGSSSYSFGEFIVGESSGRTGITYTIDPDKKAIIWGALPLNDLGLVAIDGLHSIHSDEMKELREALENQKIIVRRSQSGEAIARTRIIGCMNPDKTMNEYLYTCMGIQDNFVFRNPPEITRWDIFIPFGDGDVSKEEIMNHKAGPRPIPDEIFRRHVYWVWSRKPNQIRYTDDAKAAIISEATRLVNTYSFSNLPIVHNGSRGILARLSVAYSALYHSTDESNEIIIVYTKHVNEAVSLFTLILDFLGLAGYKEEEEGKTRITNAEFEEIAKELGEIEYEILDEIKLKPSSSSQLAEKLDMSNRSIKDHYKKLRKHELVKTTPKRGVELTARGVNFLRLLHKNNSEMVKKCFPNANPKEEMVKKNFTISPLNQVPLGKNDVIDKNKPSEYVKVRILQDMLEFVN
ncbi:MAG: hypothetical protein AB1779_07215, partial [Candidatus Thermoplasmatota archaeon]